MSNSASAWAKSGAQDLTAFGGAPPGDPATRLIGVADRIAELSRGTVSIDGPGQLTLRAHLSSDSFAPRPQFTLRGAGKMMRAADGWVAAHLPRESDRELIPALTHGAVDVCADPVVDPRAFDALEAWIAEVTTSELVDRARLLDLPLVRIPEGYEHSATMFSPKPPLFDLHPWQTSSLAPAQQRDTTLTVCDLSTLWAGPLAGTILAQAGTQVVKLESASRPERPLPSDELFVQYLNGAKRHVSIDFTDQELLRSYVDAADVVITSARGRALENLGLTPRPGQIWLRITAFGNSGLEASRIGFGDDVAAAAGAVAWHDGRPNFCADALADPITGLLGAQAVLELLDSSMTGVIDLSLFQAVKWAIRSDVGTS